MRKTLASIALALALSPLAAGATTLFDDDFAAEVPSSPGVAVLNFGSLTQWDITDGAVDLFTNGGFGLPCGSAGCLDLDGSVQNAVRMETKGSLSFVAGDVYQMTLVISGKNGNGRESLSYGIVRGRAARCPCRRATMPGAPFPSAFCRASGSRRSSMSTTRVAIMPASFPTG